MREIRIPRISANEDAVRVTRVAKGPNEACAPGDLLCVLESTKAAFDVEAEEAGYVWLTVRQGERVEVGQVLGWVSPTPVDPATLPRNGGPPAAGGEEPDGGPVVTKRARRLLAEHGLRAEEVKASGVLRAADVEAYAASLSGAGEGGAAVEGFAELERIMKSFAGSGAAEVEKLKAALAWAVETYAARWDRRVPVLDALFDRWASAERLGFGEGSNISHLSYVFGDVQVGKNTFIGPFTVIDGSGGLSIGDWCSIAAGVHIYSHDTIARPLSGGRAPLTRAATRIGNRCFVGPNAVITKGVTLGDACFVGANSVVTSDVPGHTAVQGVPARRVGRVEVAASGEVRIVPLEETP